MRTMLGLILTLAGAAIIVYGIYGAMTELAGMYQGALEDALASPQGGEEGVGDRMLRGVKIGAVGVPLLLVGSFMLKMSLFQRLRKKARK